MSKAEQMILELLKCSGVKNVQVNDSDIKKPNIPILPKNNNKYGSVRPDFIIEAIHKDKELTWWRDFKDPSVDQFKLLDNQDYSLHIWLDIKGGRIYSDSTSKTEYIDMLQEVVSKNPKHFNDQLFKFMFGSLSATAKSAGQKFEWWLCDAYWDCEDYTFNFPRDLRTTTKKECLLSIEDSLLKIYDQTDLKMRIRQLIDDGYSLACYSLSDFFDSPVPFSLYGSGISSTPLQNTFYDNLVVNMRVAEDKPESAGLILGIPIKTMLTASKELAFLS